MPKLGSKISKALLEKSVQGAPPVVIAAQATSYVTIDTPEELKRWEADMRSFYGIKGRLGGMIGSGTESCSGGCSDDCDMC